MRWPWSKPVRQSHTPQDPVQVAPRWQEAREPSIVVEEIDTSGMSASAVREAWERLAGAA